MLQRRVMAVVWSIGDEATRGELQADLFFHKTARQSAVTRDCKGKCLAPTKTAESINCRASSCSRSSHFSFRVHFADIHDHPEAAVDVKQTGRRTMRPVWLDMPSQTCWTLVGLGGGGAG